MRTGHPFAADPTVERYCAMPHLVISENGDPYGFVDEQLSKQGLRRRIALTVPNFMFALSVIAESDLIAALPRRLFAMNAPRFGVQSSEPPIPLPAFRLNAVVPKVALLDAGLAWLFELLGEISSDER